MNYIPVDLIYLVIFNLAIYWNHVESWKDTHASGHALWDDDYLIGVGWDSGISNFKNF